MKSFFYYWDELNQRVVENIATAAPNTTELVALAPWMQEEFNKWPQYFADGHGEFAIKTAFLYYYNNGGEMNSQFAQEFNNLLYDLGWKIKVPTKYDERQEVVDVDPSQMLDGRIIVLRPELYMGNQLKVQAKVRLI